MTQGSGFSQAGPPEIAAATRLTIGVLEGVIRWGPLSCWLLAPEIAERTGILSGLVGVLALCGSILGWLIVARLGRRRKTIAVSTAALLVVPLVALAHPVTGAAAVVALMAVGFLSSGYGAGLSAVAAVLEPTTRQRRLVPVRIANSTVAFASGPISQALASVADWPRVFEVLAVAAAVAAVLLAMLCPDPDGASPSENDERTEADEHGSLKWLSIGMFCAAGQGIPFAVFLPLAAVDHAVAAIGWTQIAMPVSVLALLRATRLTAAGRPRHAPGSLLQAAALVAWSSCAIAMLAAHGAGTPASMFGGWLIARCAAAGGGELYASTIFALAGSSAKGASTTLASSAIGQLLVGGVGSLIWTSVAAPLRYDLVLSFGLACGMVQLIATRQWLASRDRR